MRFFTATAAAAMSLSLLSSAHAADPAFPGITNPTQIVESVTAEMLAELVTQLGAGNVKIHEQDGKKSVTFVDGDIPHNLFLAFCDVEPGKCFGVGMLVLVDNSKLNFTLDTLNQGNKDTSFLTFFRQDADKFGVGRVDIVDGGVTRRNLGTQIGFFVIEFRESMKRLQNQLTASVPGPFQRAGLGYKQPVRAFVVPPSYGAQLMGNMENDYRARFRRR